MSEINFAIWSSIPNRIGPTPVSVSSKIISVSRASWRSYLLHHINSLKITDCAEICSVVQKLKLYPSIFLCFPEATVAQRFFLVLQSITWVRHIWFWWNFGDHLTTIRGPCQTTVNFLLLFHMDFSSIFSQCNPVSQIKLISHINTQTDQTPNPVS